MGVSDPARDGAAAAGRLPEAVSGESQDEPLVAGDGDEDHPAATLAVAGLLPIR